MERQLVSVIGVDIVDIDLFYHFINHYDPHVDKFSIVFHYKNKDTLDSFYEIIPSCKRNIQLWDGKYDENTKNNYINNLINTENTSSIIADHDEFIQFNETFFKCTENQYNSGQLIERLNIENGKIILSKVNRDIDLLKQFPHSTNFTRLFRATNKICYVHDGMHVSLGHHQLLNNTNNPPHTTVDIYHFKYNSFFDKVVDNVMQIKPGYQQEIIKLNDIISKNQFS